MNKFLEMPDKSSSFCIKGQITIENYTENYT